MWPDRVSDPGPLTYESDALPTALRGCNSVTVVYWSQRLKHMTPAKANSFNFIFRRE